MEFPFFLLVFLFLPLGIFLARRRAKQVHEAWAEAAHELGLQFAGGSVFKNPSIYGSLSGIAVKASTYRRGSGGNRRTYTRFRVKYPRPLGLGLTLKGQGVFSVLSQLLGDQDILTGDKTFDDAVVVRGDRNERVVEFLTPARRVRIQRFFSSHRNAVIDDERITWSCRGAATSPAFLVRSLQQGVGLARTLSGTRTEDRSIERVLRARHEGHIDEAMTLLGAGERLRRKEGLVRSAPAPAGDAGAELVFDGPDRPLRAASPATQEPAPGDDVEERVLEGGMLYLAGRRKEARQVFEEALQHAPEDSEIQGWVDHVAREEPPSDVAQEVQEPALDVEAVCRELFGTGVTSYHTGKIFEERYAGRRVRWSGKLRSVTTYTYDYVFGSGPGTKASFEVFLTEATAYSESWVLAVVQLPDEAKAGLEGHEGEGLAFEGVMKRADGFMKNLFLVDGRLLDG